jgi:exodeoxyribonuclease VII small subunit
MAGKRKKADQPAPGDPGGETADEPGNVDEVLDNLERIVEKLEAGDLPLETAIAAFEEGVRFARRGSEMLGAVEERVEMLLADREEVVPFEREEEGTSDDDGI